MPAAPGPPPLSTVNGPFLEPVLLLHGNLSIVAAAPTPTPTALPEAPGESGLGFIEGCLAADPAAPGDKAFPESELAGFGRMGRSLLEEKLTVEEGEDFEEEVLRGEGPEIGGEGVDCEIVDDVKGSKGTGGVEETWMLALGYRSKIAGRFARNRMGGGDRWVQVLASQGHASR